MIEGENRSHVSSPEVLEEVRGIYCPRCGEWSRPGTTVDGAFAHMVREHPRVAALLYEQFMDRAELIKWIHTLFTNRKLIAWALDIPEEMR